MKKISEGILYIGADDKDIDLFENQYKLEGGVSYNSYLIKGKKIAVADSVDERRTQEWLANLKESLGGEKPDYFIISHMESDHAGSIAAFCAEYPDAVLVGNAKTFPMLFQFFPELKVDESRKLIVKEGDCLDLGEHKLTFFMAPLVHWPEVMVFYDSTGEVLFSADAFGTFDIPNPLTASSHDQAAGWPDQARRYFINIAGKYGAQAQSLLKKAASLKISVIAPLHGPVLTGDLSYYIGLYDTWSSYKSEAKGCVVAYSTLHGNTEKAALLAAENLRAAGEEVLVFDLSRCDVSEAVSQAFKYDKLLLAAVTYDGNLMPCMQDFLYHLKLKNYCNRTVAVIQNGSWGPAAARQIQEQLNSMKNIKQVEPVVTIRSAMTEENKNQIKEAVKAILAS